MTTPLWQMRRLARLDAHGRVAGGQIVCRAVGGVRRMDWPARLRMIVWQPLT